ncbi:MAG: hypothetical protein OEZ06_11530 [Myxococcales bacterium]|nr:hypothetical protein [Myxococcales bacterium]
MKYWLPFLLSMLCASVALAEPPADSRSHDAAEALVKKKLLEPLKRAESKRKMFSRAAPVPVERRVRVLDQALLTDARGKKFVRFSVDVRRAYPKDAEWKEGALLGCAYPKQAQVFVQRGEHYVPAKGALGKEAKPRANVCEAGQNTASELANSDRVGDGTSSGPGVQPASQDPSHRAVPEPALPIVAKL